MTISERALSAVSLVCALEVAAAVVDPVPDAFPRFSVQPLAGGLVQPDGLALHPVTREIYVSEETAGRISVLRNGMAQPLITGEFPFSLEDGGGMGITRLRSPEGLCFGPDHSLYVVEDAANGRVFRFPPEPDGGYRRAIQLSLPDLGEPYAWESLVVMPDGRLFLAGSSYEATRTWGYSCTLARTPGGEWWMVDYGPLASFSALALSSEEPVLVVGDESVGSLTWWDVDLKRELQTLTQPLGGIEGLCALPDGSLAVALEHAVGGGRVVRVDPSTGAIQTLAEGLGSLESVVFDAAHGRLLVTEDSTGRVLSLVPDRPIPSGQTLLKVARRSSEAQRGLPPRHTPEFLRQFMSRVGVELVDADEAAGQPAAAKPTAMTLEELGRRIPLVAGRVKVGEMAGVEDPVTEISFLSLFPNQITQVGEETIPSLCLFAAKRRSGKVDRSEPLAGLSGGKYNVETGWEALPAPPLLMLPLATCSAVQNSNGVTVVLTFLGLSRFEDSCLTINYGRSNDAYYAAFSDRLQVAPATFTEQGGDGREVHNFAMTGVRPRRVEEATWLRLNPEANWTLLSPGIEAWISRRSLAVMPDLVARMRRFDRYIGDTLLADAPSEEEKPAVAGQEKEGPDGPAEAPRHVELAPEMLLKPVADLKFPPPHQEESESLTNIILTKIASAWAGTWAR